MDLIEWMEKPHKTHTCWWDDPVEIARNGSGTSDMTQSAVHEHWVDDDLPLFSACRTQTSSRSALSPQAGMAAPKPLQRDPVPAPTTKETVQPTAKKPAFDIARFLHLNGALVGLSDDKRLALPTDRSHGSFRRIGLYSSEMSWFAELK